MAGHRRSLPAAWVTVCLSLAGCVNPNAVRWEPHGFSTSYERYQRYAAAPAPVPPASVPLETSAARDLPAKAPQR